jgi:chain length determinant protein EpsF
MTLTQVLLILRARIWSALLVFLVIVGAAVAVSLVLPKKYTATASIVIDVRSPDPILGAILPLIGSGYMTTQIDILTSDKVAMQAVKDLQLERNPLAREEYERATGGQGPIELWLARLLQKNLDVKPARDSSVLEISYTAVDPRFAAIVANAFAKAYMDTSLAMKVEPARRYAGWFDDQIKVLRDNLEKAQVALSEYQRKAGIVATDERIDVESARLSELSTQLIALQTQSADSRSRQSQVRGGAVETMPEVLAHPLVQGLKADIARLDAKRQDLRAQYGANYPQLERIEAELASLRDRLDAETRKVIGGIGTTNQVNAQREGEVKRALEAQRAKVMAMKAQRDDQAVLVREVESAQRAYDAVSNRLTQTTLESQSSQTNVYLLSQAVEPNTHSRPKLLLNVAAAIVLGLMLGTGLAVGRELVDRRVRSDLDLVGVFDAPVLVSIDPDTRGGRGRRLLGARRAELPAPG